MQEENTRTTKNIVRARYSRSLANNLREQWLLVDLDLKGWDRILLIVCNEQNLRHLGHSAVWYGDGTFSVAP